MRCLGKNHTGSIGADMTSDTGQHIDAPALVHIKAKFGGAHLHRRIHCQRERRTAKLDRIDAKKKVMHDRIADQNDLDNIVNHKASLFGGPGNQFLESVDDSGRHLQMATWIHDPIRHPAHQILAKTDLRVHRAGRCQHIAGDHVAQMRRHGGRANINGNADNLFLQPRPDADDVAAVTKRHRHLPVAGPKNRLQLLQDMKVAADFATDALRPLRLQRLDKAAEVTGRLMHVGFAHLDQAQPDDRIHFDLPVIGGLAHKLVVNLAFRRHINDDIRLQRRLAGQAAPCGKALFLGIAGFDSRHTTQAVSTGCNAVLGELASADIHLAAPAQRPAATDRIDIHTKRPRRLQNRGSGRNMALPSRRCEDNLDVGIGVRHGVACLLLCAATTTGLATLAPTFACCCRLAELLDPAAAFRVVPIHHIRTHDPGHLLGMERVHDGRGHAGPSCHRQEGSVQTMTVRKTEGNVRSTAGRVDLEFGAEPDDQVERRTTSKVDRPDRHDQRVDNHILTRNAVILGALDDLLRHIIADIRVLGDAGLVIRDGHDGSIVFLHQRKHDFQPLLFARYRVDQRLSLVNRKTGLERGNNRAVDGQRHIDRFLDQLDGFGKDRRFVHHRNAGIHIQHGGAGLDLGNGIGDHPFIVAFGHFGGQKLASGRVDAFTDHAEGRIKSDDDFLFVGRNKSSGHGPAPLVMRRSAVDHFKSAFWQHLDVAVSNGTGIGGGARKSSEGIEMEVPDQALLIGGHAFGKTGQQQMR